MKTLPNLALNLAPFSRWTLRDKAAQRRLALRYAAFNFEVYSMLDGRYCVTPVATHQIEMLRVYGPPGRH